MQFKNSIYDYNNKKRTVFAMLDMKKLTNAVQCYDGCFTVDESGKTAVFKNTYKYVQRIINQ